MSSAKQEHPSEQHSDTLWLLIAQYRGQPMIPLKDVWANHFEGMGWRVFLHKIAEGDIDLPVIRMTESQKAPRYVHVSDLAAYIDGRQRQARKEAV